MTASEAKTASVRSLGYLVLGAKDLNEWRTFATNVLGVETVEHTDSSVRFRWDELSYRLQVELGKPDGVHTLGWEVQGAADLAELADAVEAAGYAVTRHGAGSQRAKDRAVVDVVSFTDVDGLNIELYYGLQQALTKFASPTGARFVAGRELGLGHVLQISGDPEKTWALYHEVLGFRISDYIGAARFFHCNPRHHSMAAAGSDGRPTGIYHIMLQTEGMYDVGRAMEAMTKAGAPEKATLGMHTNDKMVSFYVETPSKTQIEYGTGGIEIDDATWTVTHYSSAHYWGHDREGR